MEQPLVDGGKLSEVLAGFRLPTSMMRRIDQIAGKEARTRVQIIRGLIAHALADAEAGRVQFNINGNGNGGH